jgi:hypothetical protein
VRAGNKLTSGCKVGTGGAEDPCAASPMQLILNRIAVSCDRFRPAADGSGKIRQSAITPRPQKEKGGPGSEGDCGVAGIDAFNLS